MLAYAAKFPPLASSRRTGFPKLNQAICECFENKQYAPFSSCGTLYCAVHENQGTHPETDIIGSLYHL